MTKMPSPERILPEGLTVEMVYRAFLRLRLGSRTNDPFSLADIEAMNVLEMLAEEVRGETTPQS